jgi:hypothetical protein
LLDCFANVPLLLPVRPEILLSSGSTILFGKLGKLCFFPLLNRAHRDHQEQQPATNQSVADCTALDRVGCWSNRQTVMDTLVSRKGAR